MSPARRQSSRPRSSAETRRRTPPPRIEPGELLDLDVGPVAHGGFCVARAGGRVVFVRHALPGERVRARVTDASHDRYWRADAITILSASPDRVAAPCPHAGPGACGGCDWQHASLPAQRRGKAEVVAEALRRFGGLDARVDPVHTGVDGSADTPVGALWVRVEAVPVAASTGSGPDAPGPEAPGAGDPDDGLAWRTRMRFAVTADGEIGLRASRSHEVVATPDCRIAHPLVAAALAGRRFPGAGAVQVAASPLTGQAVVTVDPAGSSGGSARPRSSGAAVPADDETGGAIARPEADRPAQASGPDEPGEPSKVIEVVEDRTFRLTPGVFWQVHPAAAGVLVEAVRAGLRPRPGETALDLYAGAGLFAAFLAREVGPSGQVIAVESDATSVAAAAASLTDLPWISLRALRVTPATVTGLLGRGPGSQRSAGPGGPAATGGRPEASEPNQAEDAELNRAEEAEPGGPGETRGDGDAVAPGGAPTRGAVDIAVLDPPRTGAGPAVMAALLAHRPRAVAYVACDPVALARDLAAAAAEGYDLVSLRAFDLFPMTAHVECVALLEPRPVGRAPRPA